METEQITIKIEFENTQTQTTEVFTEQTTSNPITLDTTIDSVLDAQKIVNAQLTEKIKSQK